MPVADPDKLAQALPLRDIHLPPPPGWWPPAPGWWLLAGLVVLLGFLLALLWRRIKRLRYRRQALQQLADLEQQGFPASTLLAELSMLLKRAALSAFPEENCAALNGEDWLRFLDRSLKDNSFSQGIGRCLATGPYQSAVEIDRTALLSLCRRWLQRLPASRRRRSQ